MSDAPTRRLDLRAPLTAPRRFVAAGLLLLVLLAVTRFFSGSWAFLTNGSPYNLIFVAAALLLVLGAYVSEPYFTKPVDALVNAVALLVTLLGVRDKAHFFGYWFAIGLTLLLLLATIFVVAVPRGTAERIKAVVYRVVTSLGRSRVVFTAFYLAILASFFTKRGAEFWIFFTLLALLSFRAPVERFVNLIFGFRLPPKFGGLYVGEIDARLNPYLLVLHRTNDVVIRPGDLVRVATLSGRWLVGVALYDVYRTAGVDVVLSLLERDNQAIALVKDSIEPIDINSQLAGHVYVLGVDEVDGASKGELDQLVALMSIDSIVGYVAPQSSLDSIVVEVPEALRDRSDLRVASVVVTNVGETSCMYQVIEAYVDEERLSKGDSHGFTLFRAQPLGAYDLTSRQLDPPQWIPAIYSPVTIRDVVVGHKAKADEIGRLPNTEFGVPLASVEELVTHNTAVLGILGIGKSSLTFELIQKVVAGTESRVVCIDITNEYAERLKDYLTVGITADGVTAFNGINAKYATVVDHEPEKCGNVNDYRPAVRADLMDFLFGSQTIPADKHFAGDSRVRIYNPDYHKVSRGEKIGYNIYTTDLTQAEKTRIIAEQLFWILQQLGPSEGSARVLLVLEEAHSLIPEWNATAQDADRAATNGTSKVLLQGRKYGLGCLVVTQRTAHVSKSILNQCNTIFAMRIFDDTGKQFLENYVGRRYAGALPTLEERHAIVVGRAVRLRQPVIVRLNDLKDVTTAIP